jgi:iron complex outermembrane receptor protein
MTQLACAISLIGVAGMAAVHADDQPQQKVEKIEVTGSSIKRTAKEGALPVTAITKEDIKRSGATTAQDLINMIPSNFGGSVTALNIGSTGNASTAALRGLPSKYTLVLLNGRRIANYAFGNPVVDLNSIPLSAVERVEILRDGASALYGADAVAGVINFILKKNYQGAEASFYGTSNEHHGGNTESYNVTAGWGDLDETRFNAFVSANHEHDQVLKAVDRDYAKTGIRPDLGLVHTSSRNGVPNLIFTDSMGNGYGTSAGVEGKVNPYAAKGCNLPGFALAPLGASQCQTDYTQFIDLVPKQTHDNVFARVAFQLTPDHQLYAEALHVRDDVVAHYSPAPYTKSMVYPANGQFYPTSITLPAGMVLNPGYIMPDGTTLTSAMTLTSPMNVTPTGAVTGTWRTVAGGGRGDETVQTADRFLFGAKGTVGAWDYDTGITSSENKGAISFAGGQYSYAKLTPLIAAGSINVFGAQTAASASALASAELHGLENTADSKATEFDFHVSRSDLMELPAGNLGFAIGGSYRKETLDQISEPVLSSGDQVGGNGPVPSVSGGRKVAAIFTEASVPVVKDLEMQLAARYDSYKNDFGTSFSKLSPKVSFRWTPNKQWLVRGSAASGFRAPTLYENLLPFAAGQNTNGSYSDPIRCPNGVPNPALGGLSSVGLLEDECNIQLSVARSGAANLKPEKSNQWSLGFVFAPTANLSASVDYWNIVINDAIEQLSELSVINNPAMFQNSYFRFDPANPYYTDPTSPTGVSFDPANPGSVGPNGPVYQGSTNPNYPLAYLYLPYANTAKFYASGLDLNLQYKWRIQNVGAFAVNYDSTYMLQHGYQYVGVPKVSDNGAYMDYGVSPRYRHVLTTTFNRGPWTASMSNNFTLHYGDFGGGRDVASVSTWDMQTTYRGVKNLDLGVGVKNLFDKAPPASVNELFFQTGYDAQYANPLGRQYYLRATYKFF